MSINLEHPATYHVRLGTSMHRSDSQIDKADSGTDEGEYHLVARQLPRSTTRLSRDTLENGENIRARLLGTPSNTAQARPKDSGNNSGKLPLLIEIDTRDQNSTCVYEGDYEQVSHSQESEEVDCLLLYDEESKAFVIERVASSVLIKSSNTAGGSNAGGSGSTSTGQLALPANKYVAPKGGSRPSAKSQSRQDTQAALDDTMDAELARELEGALDDLSDHGDGATARPASPSRRGSTQRLHKRQTSEDQLNMELAENIDEALQDALSDDDEFEEVDNSQFMSNNSSKNLEAEVESLSDRHSNNGDEEEDEDDMIFEEVDPSAGMENGDANSDLLGATASVALLESDSDEFEEIDNEQDPSLFFNGANEQDSGSLFAESVQSSPTSASHHQRQQQSPLAHGVSADPDNEDSSEFEDLENDLARSLEDV
ncbi:hypothetical protein GQ54DRAFT_295601 [Martensiomyces pterosporus]|nr:hypothetical protein GQ54DRAFT_295601 [Martensiomyces pterosporus]